MSTRKKSPSRRRILTSEIVLSLPAGDMNYRGAGWNGVQGTDAFEHVQDGAIQTLVERTLRTFNFNPLIDLRGLKDLSADAASALGAVSDEGVCISLNGLIDISLSSATALAKFGLGALELNGVREINDEVGDALGKSSAAFLELDGLTSISLRVAKGLANYAGNLSLGGLRTLSDEVAEIFSDATCDLSLGGLATVSPNTAATLSRNKNVSFTNGLTAVCTGVAHVLVSSPGHLSLPGLKTLPVETLNILAGHRGYLGLDGFSELSTEQAKILARHPGECLSLNGLEKLTVEEAKALSAHRGGLRIGIKWVNDDVADVLAARKGELFLPEITGFSDSDAGLALAKKVVSDASHRGFDSLTSLSEKVAERLANYGGNYLQLNGLTSLSENDAKRLAMHRGDGSKGSLSLKGLQELSEGAAAALAGYHGNLELTSLSDLSDAAATALSEREGEGGVYLSGLKRLSQTAAECLTCPDTGPIKIPENLRVIDVRRVAAFEGDPDREFIVALAFYYCDVRYRGFRVMSRDQIRKLVRGLDSGAEIGTENMPGDWHEEFNVRLMAKSFSIHSGRKPDVAAMKLLFGDSVGQTDYFEAVCAAADRASQRAVEDADADEDDDE